MIILSHVHGYLSNFVLYTVFVKSSDGAQKVP